MRSFLRATALAVLCIAGRGLALDPQRTLSELHHTGWIGRDGAPGQVVALAQTSDGYLWLGTQVGVFRFDGVRFERFEAAAGEPLPSESVSALYAPASGGLWIGYRYGGASLLKNGRLLSFTEATGFSTGSVFGFAEERDGTVWVVTYQGVMVKRGPRFEWARAEYGLPELRTRAVLVGRDGTVWITGPDALFARPPGERRFSAVAHGIGLVGQIAEAPDGSIWLAEPEGSVRRLAKTSDVAESVLPEPASGLLFDRDGTLCVASAGGGLRRYLHPERLGGPLQAPEGTQTFRETDGLTADFAWRALEDREGNLWVGTARGLDRFRRARFAPVELPRGAADFAIAADRDGTLWAGTRNWPLIRIRGTWVNAPGFAQPISCAYRDDQGRVWLGGYGGIFRLDRGEVVRIAGTPPEAPGSAVQAMTLDGAGVLWVSLNVPGVFLLQDGRFTHLDKVPGLQDRQSPLTLSTDAHGRVWLGFARNRIALAEGRRLRPFTAADGLDVGNVSALAQGRSRTWIGGERGLMYFADGRFRPLRAADPQLLKGISGLIERPGGDLWVHGSRGVALFEAQEVRRALADPGYAARARRFDYLDGLPGAPAQFRPLPTAVEGGDGRLWFATTGGVVWIDPALDLRNPLPPPVLIRSLSAAGGTQAPSPALRLPPRTRRVDIEYTATSLSIPERVRFRYRLEGLDKAWREAGNRREASFDNLGPGSYRFTVTAANDDGVWNEQGASLDFEVEPAFVQTIWFRLSVALAGLVALWALYRARLRLHGERIRALLEERMLERERIARDLHDTLLQSLQGLVMMFHAAASRVQAGPAKEALDSALTLAGAAVEEGRNSVRELRATAATEQDLRRSLETLGRELASAGRPALAISVEGKELLLSPLVGDEVLRIAREALINAFRHGEAARVEVALRYGGGEFELAVRDDGRGIETAVLDAGGRAGHWGLTGMSERARGIGGTLAIRSPAGGGTSVELHVPASTAYAVLPRRGSPAVSARQ